MKQKLLQSCEDTHKRFFSYSKSTKTPLFDKIKQKNNKNKKIENST